jgi:glutaminyl-tRNA synthetase
MPSETSGEAPAGPSHFIRDIILEDLRTGKFGGRVHTRFPP